MMLIPKTLHKDSTKKRKRRSIENTKFYIKNCVEQERKLFLHKMVPDFPGEGHPHLVPKGLLEFVRKYYHASHNSHRIIWNNYWWESRTVPEREGP